MIDPNRLLISLFVGLVVLDLVLSLVSGMQLDEMFYVPNHPDYRCPKRPRRQVLVLRLTRVELAPYQLYCLTPTPAFLLCDGRSRRKL